MPKNFAATVSANPTKSLSLATAASLEIELSEMEEIKYHDHFNLTAKDNFAVVKHAYNRAKMRIGFKVT